MNKEPPLSPDNKKATQLHWVHSEWFELAIKIIGVIPAILSIFEKLG